MAAFTFNAPLAVATQEIGSGGDEVVTSVVFQISGASSLQTTPRISLDGSSATPTNCQYINVATGAVSAAGTLITADGVYGVYAPASRVQLNTTVGSATLCQAKVVYGRVL